MKYGLRCGNGVRGHLLYYCEETILTHLQDKRRMFKRLHRHRWGSEGGVGLRIVLIIASLAVVASAISWFLATGQSDQAILNRKASEICEFGLLQALAHLKENPRWTGKLPRADYEGGWYTATAKARGSNDTSFLDVESSGHIGFVSRRQGCVLRLTDSGWVRQSIR